MYVLCAHCKFKTPAGYVLCKHCGQTLPGAARPPAPLALVLQGQPPYLLAQGTVRLGRMTGNDVVLADALASRHHAAVRRDEAGRYLVEDLDSANGTYLNGVRLDAPAPVQAGDALRIGHTTLRLEAAPRSAAEEDGDLPLRPEATLVSPPRPTSRGDPIPRLPEGTLLETLVPDARRGPTFRPRARAGWALKHLVDAQGGDYYILRSFDRPAYLRLTARDVFFWKLMDGRHALRDMLVAYLQEYRALGADRLMDLLEELADKGFLRNAAPASESAGTIGRSALRARLAELARAALRAFFQREFPVQGADEIITRLYRTVGWRFYTRPGQVALGALALAGLAAFLLVLLRGGQSLFEVQGSFALGLLALGLANTISIFLHEMGHALTVKAYNRQVRRVGFMVYFGLPAFFVDTSDIWLEPRGPRIRASLAGPYVSFLVGSATSLLMLASPSALATALLFKLAAWSYIDAFLNLNPLMELDGYFVLMDWLEMPLLRKRSLRFVRGTFWGKLRRREAFTREEQLFAAFGTLCALWSVVAIGMAVFFWRERIAALLRGELIGVVGFVLVLLLVAVLVPVALRARRKGHARSKAEPTASS